MTDLANRGKLNLSDSEMAALAGGYHGNPFSILGPHLYHVEGTDFLVVRAFLPQAMEVQLKTNDELFPMERVHSDGLFQVALEKQPQDLKYKLVATNHAGQATEMYDPYAFGPTLTDYDLHLIKEGNHFHTYD